MASVPHEAVTVQSHPYRPELALLRVRLAEWGYTPNALEAIVSHAAAEGTTVGALIHPEDVAAAEEVLETAAEPVRLTDPAWDEFGHWSGHGPTYRSSGAAYLADAADYLLVTARRSVAAALLKGAALVPPEIDDETADPVMMELIAIDAINRACKKAGSVAPIAGGAPEAPYVPTEEDWREYREWTEEVERRDAERRALDARNPLYGYE